MSASELNLMNLSQTRKMYACSRILTTLTIDNYRATLCVIAVLAVGRCCLSVCLSVTLIYCTQTAKDIIKLFSRPGNPINLVSEPKRRCIIQEEPLSERVRYGFGGEIRNFRSQIQGRPMIAVEC